MYPPPLTEKTDEDRRGHQTDLPTEPPCAQTAPWLPLAHGDEEWPESARTPPRQGPQAAFRIRIGGLTTGPLAPVKRLRKRAQFQYVQKGERRGRPTLAAQARRRAPEDAPLGPPRVGFTATKKIGNAVIRNRARRRLREAARRLVPLHGLPGVDYVFLARETTGTAPWPTLLDDMKDALIRLAAALPPTP